MTAGLSHDAVVDAMVKQVLANELDALRLEFAPILHSNRYRSDSDS